MHLTTISSVPYTFIEPSISLEKQFEKLKPVIEKIDRLFETERSNMVCLTLKQVYKDFKQQPCKTAVKTLTLPVYLGLTAIGVLTSYSSISLFANANYADTFSSDQAARVDFANKITNAGALFACITDFPALTYVLYWYALQEPHTLALCTALNHSYYSTLSKENSLTAQMHESLYERHITKLQNLGIEKFYAHPDPLAPTGQLHQILLPILEDIDREIDSPVSFRSFSKHALTIFKQESNVKRLAKAATGVVTLGFAALSCFIFMENSILIVDTPVQDLFIGSSEKQNDEAFYLTQLGGGFSSLTGLGAVAYTEFRLFVQKPYKSLMREKIETSFTKYWPKDLPSAAQDTLFRIKEHKLKRWS